MEAGEGCVAAVELETQIEQQKVQPQSAPSLPRPNEFWNKELGAEEEEDVLDSTIWGNFHSALKEVRPLLSMVPDELMVHAVVSPRRQSSFGSWQYLERSVTRIDGRGQRSLHCRCRS